MKKVGVALVFLFSLVVILPLSEFVLSSDKNPAVAFIIVYELLWASLYAVLLFLFYILFHFISMKKWMDLVSLILSISFMLYIYIDVQEILYILPYIFSEIYYLASSDSKASRFSSRFNSRFFR